MYVAKEFTFEASHQIEGHFGKCARLHGHSWKLTVECEGKVNPLTGVVVDYYHIKEAVQPIIDRLDHFHLGNGFIEVSTLTSEWTEKHRLFATVKGMSAAFKPTSENLLIWIASQIPVTLPWCELTLNETCTSAARMTRTEFNRMKGGHQYGRQEGHEEGAQEGKESAEGQKDAQGHDEVKSLLDRTEITDDDIPF